MSVYVDPVIWRFRGMVMCHMTADSHAELLAMADRLNLKRSWIQFPHTHREHFDICKSKRALAVRYGAIELTLREAAQRIAARRTAATPSFDNATLTSNDTSTVPVGGGLAVPAAARHADA